jgi:hypothetical protein
MEGKYICFNTKYNIVTYLTTCMQIIHHVHANHSPCACKSFTMCMQIIHHVHANHSPCACKSFTIIIVSLHCQKLHFGPKVYGVWTMGMGNGKCDITTHRFQCTRYRQQIANNLNQTLDMQGQYIYHDTLYKSLGSFGCIKTKNKDYGHLGIE